MKRDKRLLILFIIITLASGILGYLLDQVLTDQPEGNSLGMGLWLVLPFFTGIVFRIINGDIREIGIGFPLIHQFRYFMIAILTFPVVTFICILLAGITGTLIVHDNIPAGIGMIFLTSFIANCVKNVFEEFAWRGFLTPYLEKTGMNDWLLYLISGLIWGMWHVMYYLYFLDDSFIESSRIEMIFSGTLIMIMWSVLFAELRRITKSVWPCVILHSMEDAAPTLLFVTINLFSLSGAADYLFHPVNGVVANLLILILGLYLRKLRLKKEGSIYE